MDEDAHLLTGEVKINEQCMNVMHEFSAALSYGNKKCHIRGKWSKISQHIFSQSILHISHRLMETLAKILLNLKQKRNIMSCMATIREKKTYCIYMSGSTHFWRLF